MSTWTTLPDVKFTNNIGSATFKQNQIEISDDFQFNGRTFSRSKRIVIDGMMTRDPSEALYSVTTDPTKNALNIGRRGTLVLPWTTINLVKLDSLENPAGFMNDNWIPVTATFIDDVPANNTYIITWFGITLYNPRVQIPVPIRQTNDDYIQIPAKLSQQAPNINYGNVEADNPWYGPIRSVGSYGMMEVTVSGTMLLPDGIVTPAIIATLTQRNGQGTVYNASLPAGYPNVFNLRDAIPQLAADAALNGCFVAGGQLAWDVERVSARVTLKLLAQPQQWENAA